MLTHRILKRLKLTQIRPEGWLQRQLEIQMNGLSGRLYEIWDSVGSYSGWLGGTGESWERAPYYLDGLLPLSWYLDDKEHMAICLRFINWTLASQTADGNFGPRSTADDFWSRYVMLKVLIQYAEITNDVRVLPFMLKYFEYIVTEVEHRPLLNWSKARVPDLLYSMKWVYEICKDEHVAIAANRMNRFGYDWVAYFKCLPFPLPTDFYFNWQNLNHINKDEHDQFVPFHGTHIVNVAMGLKHPAMEFAFTGDMNCREAFHKGIEDLERNHGVVSGCINGDEHLAGNDPNRGAELCSVVEAMFSLAASIEVFGETELADRMERLAYNALPATISEDYMGHQYLQQANQVLCTNEKRPWFNNGSDSSLFGLEPHFGCCTANMHQGWTKFVDSLWFQQGDDTLVSMVFAPSTVTTQIDNEVVSVRLATEYPFRDMLTYHIVEAPGKVITLKILIPGWCKDPELNGQTIQPKDGFVTCTKVFFIGESITLRLPMHVQTSRWFRNSIAVERGSLAFGLDIREKWVPFRELAGVTDFQIYPDSKWNYALDSHLNAIVEESKISDIPFSKQHAPVRLRVKAKEIPIWQMCGGNAGTLPMSPVKVDTSEEQVELIPFGCTKLRISEFPAY